MIWSVENGVRQRVVRVDLQGHLVAEECAALLTRLEEILREHRVLLVIDGSRVSGCHAHLATCWASRLQPFRAHLEALVVGFNATGMSLFKSAMVSFARQLPVRCELRPGPVPLTSAELRRELDAQRFFTASSP
jgi:hypothetical protein